MAVTATTKTRVGARSLPHRLAHIKVANTRMRAFANPRMVEIKGAMSPSLSVGDVRRRKIASGGWDRRSKRKIR
jgi:hypothetical protein